MRGQHNNVEVVSREAETRHPADDDLQPGTVVSDYRIEDVSARGGMAVVYRAVHPVLGKRAAIKVISHALFRNREAVDAFLHEARAINQIRHPNLVDVFTFSTLPDGRSYFLMEWLDGESLRARLSRASLFGPALSMAQACDVLIQVCDALDAAHAEHIVHLDLKPENVHLVPLRGDGLMVKLIDFGIAEHFGPESSVDGLTGAARSGFVAGTPTYMSPEQAQGRELNAASDIYSLGVMAYEMFVGEAPFTDTSQHSLLFQHVHAEPPNPQIKWPGIPFRLEHLLLHMLAKDPLERPPLMLVRNWLVKLRDLSVTVAPRSRSDKQSVQTTVTDPIEGLASAAKKRAWPARHWRATAVLLSGMALLIAFGLAAFVHPAIATELRQRLTAPKRSLGVDAPVLLAGSPLATPASAPALSSAPAPESAPAPSVISTPTGGHDQQAEVRPLAQPPKRPGGGHIHSQRHKDRRPAAGSLPQRR